MVHRDPSLTACAVHCDRGQGCRPHHLVACDAPRTPEACGMACHKDVTNGVRADLGRPGESDEISFRPTAHERHPQAAHKR